MHEFAEDQYPGGKQRIVRDALSGHDHDSSPPMDKSGTFYPAGGQISLV